MKNRVTKDQWIGARVNLLQKEKELTRIRGEVARARRDLPWHLVEKDYRFSGQDGECTFLDLFGRKSQLVI